MTKLTKIPCETCGKLIVPKMRGTWIAAGRKGYSRKYCSHACGAKARIKESITHVCGRCGKSFVKPVHGKCRSSRGKAKFCSRQCSVEHTGEKNRGASHKDWKGGVAKTFSRDYKLVQKAIARGEVVFPDGWKVRDPDVQKWLEIKREQINKQKELQCLKKQVRAMERFLKTGDLEALKSLPPGYGPATTSPAT